MDDRVLTQIALVIELGLPIFLVFGIAFRPAKARRLLIILGAVTPWLFLYMFVAVGFWTDGRQNDRFAFYAMWIMTLIPYLACAALGYVVSWFVFPVRAIWSYAVGLAVPAIILIGALIV